MSHDIAVSFSRKQGFTAADHHMFYVAHGPFSNIPNFITKRPWSPIVWKDGKRRKDNFLSSSLVVFDFDDGRWTMEDAIQYAKRHDLTTVIATTKSHRKVKDGKPACDRFRMVLAAELCTSLDDFEYTMRTFMTDIPCDKSCKDGGRFYFPCAELVWTANEGGQVSWLTCPYEDTEAGREEAYGAVDPEDMRNLATLPHYVWTYITYGSRTERHKAAYILSCELAKRGFSEAEILALLVKHKSPLLNIGEGKDDVRRCVENGCSKVARHQAEKFGGPRQATY